MRTKNFGSELSPANGKRLEKVKRGVIEIYWHHNGSKGRAQ